MVDKMGCHLLQTPANVRQGDVCMEDADTVDHFLLASDVNSREQISPTFVQGRLSFRLFLFSRMEGRFITVGGDPTAVVYIPQ